MRAEERNDNTLRPEDRALLDALAAVYSLAVVRFEDKTTGAEGVVVRCTGGGEARDE